MMKKERLQKKCVKSLTVKDSLEDSKSKRIQINLGGKNSVPERIKNPNPKKLLQILRASRVDPDQGPL